MRILSAPLNGKSGHEVGLALLKTLYGSPLPEIAHTPMGKPYFIDCPLHFSISHTKHYAFCVLSDKPVGIDAEEISRQINPALAEKILSPGELAQYRLSADPNRALLKFWVLKEAAGKCTGEGLRVYPNHTNFSLNDPRVQEINDCLVAIVESQ